jgi:sucrose-phosphate synthase
VPLIFTGHSLGRVKKQRLLEKGSKASAVETQYNIAHRIEAEEITLGNASLVITSTHQEVEEQYELYDNYHVRRMQVIPPGVDLERFYPMGEPELQNSKIKGEIDRFLNRPEKPMILALSRADERKNITSLIKAYGTSERLRELANLIIIAGNRDDINTLDKGAREVMTHVLHLIDRYDLYGSVAYPKHHEADDVPIIYGLAARSKGVFVNPALTEPFGLTLIEAGACGLPLVATNDGGPRDIIGLCKNGMLIDPLNIKAMAEAITSVLEDSDKWEQWSQSSRKGTREHFSWRSHVGKYLGAVENVLGKARRVTDLSARRKSRLINVDRLLVCDVDDTLLGDEKGLVELIDKFSAAQHKVGLVVATGRGLDSTLEVLEKYKVPPPDVLITSVGSEIFYGHQMTEDSDWAKHIDYRWRPKDLREALELFPGLQMQPQANQRKYKLSYFVDPEKAPSVREIRTHLRKKDLHAKIIYSHQAFLDFLPLRASKGLAVRYLTIKWGLESKNILVAGDSGNDEEMLRSNTLGVVVGNYSPELKRLRGRPDIYFAQGHYAWGIMEGIDHFHFLNDDGPVTEPAATEESQEYEATVGDA